MVCSWELEAQHQVGAAPKALKPPEHTWKAHSHAARLPNSRAMETTPGNPSFMGDDDCPDEVEKRIPFVSRRRSGHDPLSSEPHGSPNHALPRLTERTTLLLLGLTIMLQVFAWSSSNGYQLADSVEFMDRASAVARGERLDTTGAVRGFGFSTFLLPFFHLGEWLESGDMRGVVHAIRGLQMLFGLGLVFSVARLGAILGGRQVGYVAGLLVAVNPVYLQYSSDPVSGIAAAFFISCALNILIVRRVLWTSAIGGLLLGLAFMMAYQSIVIAVPLIGLLFLRDRWKNTKNWAGAALGLTLALIIQVVLDKLTYDSWGISIRTYLIENTGGASISLLIFLGLEDAQWVRDAYESYARSISPDVVVEENQTANHLQSPLFYLTNLPSMLVWPVMVMGVLGLAHSWLKMNWRSSILILLLALNVAAMSLKGSKSFRLWLPLLPMIGPICALGWGWLVSLNEVERASMARRWLGAALLVAALILGVRSFDGTNTRRYGAYWEAMEFINERAAADRMEAIGASDDPGPAAAGSAYNWAVFCRDREDVRLIKLPEHLDRWHQLDDEQRARVIEQLGELEWLIVHGPILSKAQDLSTAINSSFEIVASFWDEDTDRTIGEVRVLRSLRESPPDEARGLRARRLWEVIEGVDPGVYRDEEQLDHLMPQPALLLGQGQDGRVERLQLLGIEYQTLPGAGFGWMTYHWYTDTGFDRDYVLVDRISTRMCPWSWQNNRQPGHGALPTSEWKPGWIVRESYLVMLGFEPFDEDFKPLGGSYRRGDLLPAMVWIRAESPPPNIDEHLLLPASFETGEVLDFAQAEPWVGDDLRLPDGRILSSDQLLLVSRPLLPCAERYSWPDDGHPGPDDAVLLENLRRKEQLLEDLRLLESGEASGE
jgi:hypothetical protein